MKQLEYRELWCSSPRWWGGLAFLTAPYLAWVLELPTTWNIRAIM